MLFPLYWMIATSFKSAEEVQLVIPTLFPHEFHPENYLNVLQKANFMKYYWNTIVMTAGILLLQVGTGVLAAYGFAVGRFKGPCRSRSSPFTSCVPTGTCAIRSWA